jgi:replicative DNA helicase
MTADIRTPPLNFEAEQAVLGSIMMNSRAFEAVSDFLRPEYFAEPAHGRIFAVCRDLIGRGRKADPITLKPILENDPSVVDVGGFRYVAQIAAAEVPMRMAADYGRQVFDLHTRRALIEAGQDLIERAYDTASDTAANAIQEAHEAVLFELASSGAAEGDLREFGEFVDGAIAAWDRAHKNRGAPSGIPTGLVDLDARLGGLNRSDLIILAGRPAMGKTSLAVSAAVNAAMSGAKIGFFSLEMAGHQLAQRVISAHAGVDGSKARMGQLENRDFEKLAIAGQEIRDLGMFIDDTAAVTVQAIRNRARRLKRRKGLDVVVVDYIGLATPTTGNGNRVHEIEGITKGLKALAKELDVPVVALSQLSRAVEQREDKRPMLSDLRDSGSIEQDADCVLFVYRDEYYAAKCEPQKREGETDQKFNDRRQAWEARMAESQGKAECIIAKNRHGQEGTVALAFDGPTTRFSNLYQGGEGWPA